MIALHITHDCWDGDDYDGASGVGGYDYAYAYITVRYAFRGEFLWFYEVQGVDIFFENGRKLTSLVIGLY